MRVAKWVIVALASGLLTAQLVPSGEAAQSAQARVVRGIVFEDANGNGQRDAGERGLGGAGVSDQFGIATTTADGSYELTAAAGADLIFVSVADGWTPTRRFWHALSSEREQRVDFALKARPAASEFTFVHASDTHVSAESLPRLRRFREMVEQMQPRPAFVLITGDLIRDALRVPETEARGYYEMLVAELARFTVPVWTVPGNHEIFGVERHLSLVSSSHPLYGKKMYRHYLGPNYYSFTWGGVRFVALDTADVDDLWYYGHVNAEQLAWLQRDLAGAAADASIVTFNHIPLASAVDALHGFDDDSPAPSVIRLKGRSVYRHVVSNTEDVLGVIRTPRLEIALGGHMHTRESLVYETDGRRVRFHQSGAIVGPNKVAGLTMTSGFTVYRTRNGKIDDGTFVPLEMPR